ncbi:MAG TPA: hypothetical protein VFV41_18835, partial [Streptosporangiaceae bacterium]|nr:hypothetical protein [Streptosporangiaceae bacterium]
PGTGAGCRVEVVAERGAATAELPDRLSWRDEAGRHLLRLRGPGDRGPERQGRGRRRLAAAAGPR